MHSSDGLKILRTSDGLFVFIFCLLVAGSCFTRIILKFISNKIAPQIHADNLLNNSSFMNVEVDFVTQYVPGFQFDKFKEAISQKRDDMIDTYDTAWDQIMKDEGWKMHHLRVVFDEIFSHWKSDRISNDYVMRDNELTKLMCAMMSPYEFEMRQNKYKSRIFQASTRDSELYTHANCAFILLIDMLEAVVKYVNPEQNTSPRRHAPDSLSSNGGRRSREDRNNVVYWADIKKPLRLRKKTAEDDSVKGTDCLHSGDFGRVLDICRGSICCNSLHGLQKALEFFTKFDGKEYRAGGMMSKAHLLRAKDRLLYYSLDGYRNITLYILFEISFDEFPLPDSRVFKYHVVEVQLHHEEILAQKKLGGGHVVYKWLRRQMHNRDRYYTLVEKKRGKRMGNTLTPTMEHDEDSVNSSEKRQNPQFARVPSWHSTYSILDTLKFQKGEMIQRPTGNYKSIDDMRELQVMEAPIQGLIISSDGGVYEGGLLRGLRHGEGTFTFPNGDLLETRWAKDVPNGVGHYNWVDGSDVVGVWRNGLPHSKFLFHVMCQPKIKKIKYHRGRALVSWTSIMKRFLFGFGAFFKNFMWHFMGMSRNKELFNNVLSPAPHFLSAQQRSNLRKRTQLNKQNGENREPEGNTIENTLMAVDRLHNKLTRAISNRTPGRDSRPGSRPRSRPPSPLRSRGEETEEQEQTKVDSSGPDSSLGGDHGSISGGSLRGSNESITVAG